MKTRVYKWGNSLALRIPQALAAKMDLHAGSLVEISSNNGRLVVAPVYRSKLTLDQLLAQVTDENLHHEVETGSARGNETPL